MVKGFPQGRMISSSKSGYRLRYPDHLVLFNANIFTQSGSKIWWGDLDITMDGEQLQAMAAEAGEELYIFLEADGRSAPPVREAAIAHVTVDAVTIL